MIIIYFFLFIILLVIYLLYYSVRKYYYFTYIKNKIFPLQMSDVPINKEIRSEKDYHRLLQILPRKATNSEIIYLLQYKKFLDLPNVYSMCQPNEVQQTTDLLVDIIKNKIVGCLVETGVWRGGMGMWIKNILNYYGEKRNLWLFDTFEYFPEPSNEKDKFIHNITKFLFENVPSVEDVKNNFIKYGLYDNSVHFVVGDIKSTVPKTYIRPIALLRLDADYYEPTMVVLENYYFNISNGGYIIIDDYNNNYLACKKAVDDFRDKHNIKNKIIDTHRGSVYWKI